MTSASCDSRGAGSSELQAQGQRFRARLPLAAVVGLAAAVLVIVGSAVGPWANVAGELHVGGQIERFQIHGMVGDGVFTLSLSAVTALLILWRILRGRASGFMTGLAVVLLLIAAVIGMLNWADIDHMPGVYVPAKHFHSDARAAWGLLTTTFGAAVGAVAMAYQVWNDELR
jgi:hypothetical protein